MRLELEQNPSPVPYSEQADAETNTAARVAEAAEYLREGIKAAQAGNRTGARAALLRAAELDPRSESAWLWLSSISEYPEELFVFLTNVLEINPENARALEWAAATRSLLAKNFVQRGIDAVESNQPEAAVQYFNQALEYDEQNSMAWLWLASLSESSEGKLTYLEKVLEFDPDNEAAGAAYKSARDSIRANLLAEARTAAVAGRSDDAHELLNAIIAEEPDAEDAWVLRSHLANGFEDKIEAFKRILQINPENLTARASLDSLTSIMDAVTPKADLQTAVEPASEVAEEAEPVSEHFEVVDDIDATSDEISYEAAEAAEFAEESAAPDEFVEESQPAIEGSETPAWMEIKAETETEEVYDGMIRVNDTDETLAGDSVDHIPAGFVDTDAENEYESPEPDAGFNYESTPGSEQPRLYDEPANELADGLSAADAEAVEEINYELTSDEETFEPEAATETADEPDEKFAVQEDVNFTASNVSPFSKNAPDPVTDAYPTVASVRIEPEMFANVQNLYAVDSSPDAGSLEQADTGELPFAMTLVGGGVPLPETNQGFDVPFDMTMFGANIPRPDSDLDQPSRPLRTGYETRIVSPAVASASAPKDHTSVAACPFCRFENDSSAVNCHGCMAVLTLADLEMLLANLQADKFLLRQAVDKMEGERLARVFDTADLTMLGIGHLNLKNLQFGYNCLLEASQLNPNDVVLCSQVNALLIRLEEIKKQNEVHGSMTRGKKILVVDDSPTVRKLIAGKLEKCGHNVICSNDGVEAIEQLETLHPDLILLDITMPRMDGYQVCKLIRNNPVTKDVPVIMISGKDGFFDKVRGRMAGTSGYITKPFGPETLMKAVESYLKADAAA